MFEKGFRSMSRMTLLDANVWLSLAAPRAPNGAGKAGDAGYPPYNIELLPEGERGPEALRVTLAVAGFSAEDLEVSIEEGELTIRGKQREERAREYLHRGIAARQFKRTFPLANGVEVCKAELDNGLLAIELVRPRQEKRVLKVGIAAAD
ncbi:MAG TPA: Hsp20 family protein [Methyloceanibacter sp.]|nr:Hsp20 family protein [Methyloceanibacter sp.]